MRMPTSPRRLFCGTSDFRLQGVLRALTLGISLLPAAVAQAQPVVMLKEQEAGVSAVVAENPSAWPELITVQARCQNMQPSRAVPFTVELPPGARIEVRRGAVPVRLVRLHEAPFTDRLVAKFGLPVEGWRGSTERRHRLAQETHDA